VHQIEDPEGRGFAFRSTLLNLFTEDRGLLLDLWAREWLGQRDLLHLVPEIHSVEFRNRGAPFDFSIMQLAEGSALKELGDTILDQEPAYLFAFGRVLRAVHSIEASGAGLIDCEFDAPSVPSGVHHLWSDYINVRLETHVLTCREAGYLTTRQAETILRFFEVMKSAIVDRPIRLLHGDPGIHNICVCAEKKQLTALFDWEDALAGDPLFDVAMVSSFQPQRRLSSFLLGYGLSQPSAEERRLIAFYFLRIALSKTVHRLRFGLRDRPNRAPAHYRIYRGMHELKRLL
jgi:aminoglycoside phosphotransferase (APT) family kinase protein